MPRRLAAQQAHDMKKRGEGKRVRGLVSPPEKIAWKYDGEDEANESERLADTHQEFRG